MLIQLLDIRQIAAPKPAKRVLLRAKASAGSQRAREDGSLGMVALSPP